MEEGDDVEGEGATSDFTESEEEEDMEPRVELLEGSGDGLGEPYSHVALFTHSITVKIQQCSGFRAPKSTCQENRSSLIPSVVSLGLHRATESFNVLFDVRLPNYKVPDTPYTVNALTILSEPLDRLLATMKTLCCAGIDSEFTLLG